LTFDVFTLKLVRIIACGVNNFPTNFGVSRTLCSRLIGQHLSDASRDLATLTFDLEYTALVVDADLPPRLCTKFELRIGLPVRKILHIYCVGTGISRPGDLDI